MKEPKAKYINCYQCSVRMDYRKAKKKKRSDPGDTFYFCDECHSNSTRPKPNFIKRSREAQWQPA